jgi:hypothetical protein
MSDRAVPHYQTNSGNSQGSSYHGSSLRHTQTSSRPGATTPGGYGVDIKHNSYNRYMNRLKAKKDIRRGAIPPNFGAPIPFNPAFPIYGGKTVKTGIVSGCNCPADNIRSLRDDAIIYQAHFDPFMFSSNIVYKVGQYVYARVSVFSPVLQAKILDIDPTGTLFTIQFTNGSGTTVVSNTQVLPYFPCSCAANNSSAFAGDNGFTINGKIVEFCYILNTITGPNYLQSVTNTIAPAL